VSLDIDSIVARARMAAERPDVSSQSTERDRLLRLAQEFEASLMTQMLREMRKTGRWKDDEEGEEGLGLTGSQSLFEMLDSEFSTQLIRAQSLGLTPQLMDAFDRMQRGASPEAAVSSVTSLAPVQVSSPTGNEPNAAAPDAQDRLVARDQITSGFGWRRDPMTGETRFHKGIDLRAAYGQDVVAAADGRVASSGEEGSYGTSVVLEHADGTRTRYAHLSVALVHEGDTVRAGQALGRAGSSGRATGPHLHFEVLDRDGAPLDPLDPRPSFRSAVD
jgi:murein DD-endopeptidase MepM/ murein hydrolase activator NlpD